MSMLGDDDGDRHSRDVATVHARKWWRVIVNFGCRTNCLLRFEERLALDIPELLTVIIVSGIDLWSVVHFNDRFILETSVLPYFIDFVSYRFFSSTVFHEFRIPSTKLKNYTLNICRNYISPLHSILIVIYSIINWSPWIQTHFHLFRSWSTQTRK